MAGISYEYRSPASEVSHNYLYGPVAELLADTPGNALVVDIGCGNGSFLSLFQSRGWELHGSDYSPTGIEIARASYPNIKFSLDNAESMPEELVSRAGQFDVVLNTEMIEHVYKPRGLLKTC
jgi:2-polyprenyl-6-hydroxyphenyl methylase/3-demethylubiquinone-9 3-methyltransferase